MISAASIHLKKFGLQLLCLLSASTLVSGCLETSSGNSAGTSVIPDVEVQCNQASCQPSSSAVVYVGLISDLSTSCQNYILDFTSINAFEENFEAWGTGTIALDGGFQRVFITTWNYLDSVIGRLPNDTYKICGFYDTNGDDNLDLGEGVGEETIDLETSPVYFDNWFPN